MITLLWEEKFSHLNEYLKWEEPNKSNKNNRIDSFKLVILLEKDVSIKIEEAIGAKIKVARNNLLDTKLNNSTYHIVIYKKIYYI